MHANAEITVRMERRPCVVRLVPFTFDEPKPPVYMRGVRPPSAEQQRAGGGDG